jgi:hypothetical protein
MQVRMQTLLQRCVGDQETRLARGIRSFYPLWMDAADRGSIVIAVRRKIGEGVIGDGEQVCVPVLE